VNQAQVRTILWLSFLSGALLMLMLVLITPAMGTPNEILSIALLSCGIGLAAVSAFVPRTGAGQSYLVGLALADAAAVLGVVLHFVTGWPHAWALPVAGMAAMGMQFPRSD
jgi:hypothetical protein